MEKGFPASSPLPRTLTPAKPLLAALGLLLAAAGIALTAPAAKPKKNVGPCMPYAEKCLNCVDCTQCKHCAKDHGKCSVCWTK